MAKLKVQNVGPIREGFIENDGYLDIKEVTVFIGTQGSGKSTIAKLFSTLSWIEKALMRKDFSPKEIAQYKRFEKQVEYQNIKHYLGDKSLIHYIGDAYELVYENNKFTAYKSRQEQPYLFPKIMYVPAERNFISAIDRPELVKRLPRPLFTFMAEYDEAKKALSETVDLPIGNTKFEYRKQSGKSYLIGKDYSIELLEGSSGFQSFVPVFLVTRHLSKRINHEQSENRKENSLLQEARWRKMIEGILKDKSISDDFKTVLLKSASTTFAYQRFINIVEEPEQNLYPTSQQAVLYQLLRFHNKNLGNKLVLSTHSPYIISYLTLAVKAYQLEQGILIEELKNKLWQIVPKGSSVSPDSLAIYQFEGGSISTLAPYEGLPSDENTLNDQLGATNELFSQLLEIEQQSRHAIL